MRRIIILAFAFFSNIAIADTYPAVSQINYCAVYNSQICSTSVSSVSAFCTGPLAAVLPSSYLFYGVQVLGSSSYCNFVNSSGAFVASPQVNVTTVYICPNGGTLSGTSCVNATACTVPQVRNATTGACQAPPVTCNATPSLTSIGGTQTVTWQTTNTATNSCTNNSFSCNAPLVANVEMKRCDLTCSDGTTVNVSGGAQCPPPVCVGGQTLNTATNTCQDPVCSALQVLNPATHTCINNAVCVGGQTQNTSTMPYSCNEPVCAGIQLLNTTTHMCENPPPAVCVGGQTLNTATNTCTDPVCSSGYHLNAGKICENDGECPLFTTKTMVDGVLKCATTPTATKTNSTTGNTTNTTSPGTTSNTTTTNPDGTVSHSTTTTPGDTITTTNNSTTNSTCDDCAKESTLREVVKKLDAKKGTSIGGTGEAGKWYTASNKTYESILQDGLTQVQNSPIMSFGKDIFSVSIPGGSCPQWQVPAVMGMQAIDVSVLCGDLAELMWPVVSGVLQFLSVLMAFRIALSAV